MKENRHRRWLMLFGVTAAVMLLTGCVKIQRVDKLLEEVLDEYENMDSMSAEYSLTVEGAFGDTDKQMDWYAWVDMEMSVVKEPYAYAGSVCVDSDFIQYEAEIYGEEDPSGDEINTYINRDGTWTKEAEVREDIAELLLNLEFLRKSGLKMDREASDQNTVVVKGEIPMDHFIESDDPVIKMLEGSLPDVEVSATKAEVTVWIDPKMKQIRSLRVELSEEDALDIQEMGFSLDGMVLEVWFWDFNRVDTIEIPEEANSGVDVDKPLDDMPEEDEGFDVVTDKNGNPVISDWRDEKEVVIMPIEGLKYQEKFSSRHVAVFDIPYDKQMKMVSVSFRLETDDFATEEYYIDRRDSGMEVFEGVIEDMEVEPLELKRFKIGEKEVCYLGSRGIGESYIFEDYLAWIRLGDGYTVECVISGMSNPEEGITEETIKSYMESVKWN